MRKAMTHNAKNPRLTKIRRGLFVYTGGFETMESYEVTSYNEKDAGSGFNRDQIERHEKIRQY